MSTIRDRAAGRRYRYRSADRNLLVRHLGLRWWKAYLLDLARHPFAPRCHVNPYNRFREPSNGYRCHVLNVEARPVHHHGTERQFRRALAHRQRMLKWDAEHLRQGRQVDGGT